MLPLFFGQVTSKLLLLGCVNNPKPLTHIVIEQVNRTEWLEKVTRISIYVYISTYICVYIHIYTYMDMGVFRPSQKERM